MSGKSRCAQTHRTGLEHSFGGQDLTTFGAEHSERAIEICRSPLQPAFSPCESRGRALGLSLL
jgi:hypothetical protein